MCVTPYIIIGLFNIYGRSDFQLSDNKDMIRTLRFSDFFSYRRCAKRDKKRKKMNVYSCYNIGDNMNLQDLWTFHNIKTKDKLIQKTFFLINTNVIASKLQKNTSGYDTDSPQSLSHSTVIIFLCLLVLYFLL